MKTPHKWYKHLSLYCRNNRGVYCSCMPLTYWCDHPATVCVRAHPSRTGVRPPPPVYTPAERQPPLHWYPHPPPAVTMNGVSGSKHARACVSKSKTLNTCNFSDILVPRPHADYGQTTKFYASFFSWHLRSDTDRSKLSQYPLSAAKWVVFVPTKSQRISEFVADAFRVFCFAVGRVGSGSFWSLCLWERRGVGGGVKSR